MTKLHTKNRKMTSRKAVAPVIATLLLVAIAVVGGSIIFVFSQGFFSSAQISGSPQIESVEIIGYDASDVETLEMHDGELTINPAAAGFDGVTGAAGEGILQGERITIYLQNQSAQTVTLAEVSLAGVTYAYAQGTGVLDGIAGTQIAEGEYGIATKSNTASGADLWDGQVPELQAGEEVSIVIELAQNMSSGRDAQFKIETGTGSIFVGTVIAGQQSG